MSPKQQLEYLIRGKLALAVDDYLNRNCSLPKTLPALARKLFDAWADGIELPCGRVQRKLGSADGIYVLPDPEGWLVIRREKGAMLPERRMHATYKEAKRAALTEEFLEGLRGPG